MDSEQHKKRHVELHQALDELAADFVRHNRGKHLGDTSILELLQWSGAQSREPTPDDGSLN